MGLGTFFDLETRAGECGEKHKNTDLVAALNVEQMGNDKKECNKEIEVMGPNEKKVRVKVVDVCKTCKKGDLDLSPKAFEALGEFGLGEVSIKWHFV
ncbi:RlpA-like double-psi beta-barrel-protein domain-containing protein-containing protein [Phycomyces blakesleeanus]